LLVLATGLPLQLHAAQAAPTAAAHLFPETGKTLDGRFYEYWLSNGGLAQQGYPISDQLQERSDTDGKTYTVQYLERAEFEYHPENQPPNDVLLSLLGVFLYNQKYPNGAPGQTPNTSAGSVLFKQTGKRVGSIFLDYWNSHGGLAQQGYPISDEFMEKSDLDGKTYRVQYFQRAVFEYHPENQPPYNVLLSQLGTFRYRAKYGQPSSGSVVIPTPVAGCTSNLAPGMWQGPAESQFTLTSDNGLTGNGDVKANLSLLVKCDGTFTGTATTTDYAAHGSLNGLPVQTCTATESPVVTFQGKVVPESDGLHLMIPGGTYQAGAISCQGPVGAPQVQNLKGQSIGPADVKVESVSQGKISGSQWLPDPTVDIIKEKVHSYFPNATITVTTTSHWELDYKPANTP
jgi:hypothetical protein